MNKSKRTTFIFIAIIMFFAITPLILPKTLAKVNYEDVEEVTNLNNMVGKIYKNGTRIHIPYVELKYYLFDTFLWDVTANYQYDMVPCVKYSDPDAMCKEYIYDFEELGSYSSNNIGNNRYSEYWKVKKVTPAENDNEPTIIELEAVYDKPLDGSSLLLGEIFPTASPIDACKTINYYDYNGNLIHTFNPNIVTKEDGAFKYDCEDGFCPNMDDDSYYLGRGIPSGLLTYDDTSWRIIDIERGPTEPKYNCCETLSVQEVGNLEAYGVSYENDEQYGTFNDIDDTENRKFINGEVIHFSIEPKEGYKVDNIEIKNNTTNETVNYTQNNNNYEFVMPESDVSIKVNYRSDKYSIGVEVVNETEDLTVQIDDLTQVPEGEEVKFKVTPIKGYKVTSIRIIDDNNNEVDYNTTDNKNYTFTMPGQDVTIIPSYERVSSEVEVEDNTNTKEIKIEVNDATAVVYEDTVRFTVEPQDGYEVEDIKIIDKDGNEINYRKTDKENEYEFVMPDTDVIIKPKYRLIPKENKTIFNPNTKRQIKFIIFSILILLVLTNIYVKKKNKTKERL